MRYLALLFWIFFTIGPVQAADIKTDTLLQYDPKCCKKERAVVLDTIEGDIKNLEVPEIGIIRFDLNGDGQMDFLSRIMGGYYCGMQNCPVNAYIQQPSGKYISVLNVSSVHLLQISSRQTGGYNDLLFPRLDDGFSRWIWNGKAYAFDQKVEK